MENFIPKIIHQTAPSDKNKWDKSWEKCQQSWKKYFPEKEYKHMMWTDEDLDNFMKDNYPEYYQQYMNYDRKIKKIDLARYFILHKMGGIYADMDYKCFKNFYDNIPDDKISIVKSPYPWEDLQNALMISPPNNDFWMKVAKESTKRTKLPVLSSTGPILISDVYNQNKDDVNILSVDEWNPLRETPDSDKLFTRHLGTFSWNKKIN